MVFSDQVAAFTLPTRLTRRSLSPPGSIAVRAPSPQKGLPMPPATHRHQRLPLSTAWTNLLSRLAIMPATGLLCGQACQTTEAAGSDSLWVSTTPLDASRQLLLVVDPLQQVLAVYHVDTATGIVTLRSTRALAYDLQLEDFNAAEPKPGALKKMLQVGGTVPPAPVTIVPPPPPSGPTAP